MENQDIRLKARGSGVSFWEIADYIGVSEPTFTRIMRRPVDKETKHRILNAIAEIKSRRGVK